METVSYNKGHYSIKSGFWNIKILIAGTAFTVTRQLQCDTTI